MGRCFLSNHEEMDSNSHIKKPVMVGSEAADRRCLLDGQPSAVSSLQRGEAVSRQNTESGRRGSPASCSSLCTFMHGA